MRPFNKEYARVWDAMTPAERRATRRFDYLVAAVCIAFMVLGSCDPAAAFIDYKAPTHERASATKPHKHKHVKRKHPSSASINCLQPSTKALWAKVTAHWGPMRVISTCRPGAKIRGTNRTSRHAHGHAIDFYAPKGKKQAVVRWLIANHTSGGVMTYRNHGHIHIDIGPRFVSLGARG
jgi:uncharacterized protein YcbK (DUF882 family)